MHNISYTLRMTYSPADPELLRLDHDVEQLQVRPLHLRDHLPEGFILHSLYFAIACRRDLYFILYTSRSQAGGVAGYPSRQPRRAGGGGANNHGYWLGRRAPAFIHYTLYLGLYTRVVNTCSMVIAVRLTDKRTLTSSVLASMTRTPRTSMPVRGGNLRRG